MPAAARAGATRTRARATAARIIGGSSVADVARMLRRDAGQRVVDGGGEDAHVVVGERAEDQVGWDARATVAVDAILPARLRVALVGRNAETLRLRPGDAGSDTCLRLAAGLDRLPFDAVGVAAAVGEAREPV